MDGLAEWLEKLGMSKYAQRFAENAIDLSVLPDLTDQDLEELGVLLGHRRKILCAIAALNGAPPTVAPAALAVPLDRRLLRSKRSQAPRPWASAVISR